MKKFSFDYDETLSEYDVQEFAKELIAKGYDVWVVTSRCDDHWPDDKDWSPDISGNRDLYFTVAPLGIPHEKVLFTNGSLKHRKLVEHGFNFHLDNLVEEVEGALRNGIDSALFGYYPDEFEKFIEWKNKF